MASHIVDEPVERRMEETKRIGRVLKIASLITSQPRQWKRSGLATLFEVNERSIDRDLELLRGLGYEILRTEQGYAFARTPSLPPMVLSLPEVLALTLAAGLARDSGDIDTASLGAALAQLEALVPHSARPLVRREILQESNVASLEQRRASLAILQRALLERHCVSIVYATASRGGAVSERIVEPYHLQHYERFWILVAYDHLRREVRDFKVDRIHAITLLEQTYTIPADFDLASYRGNTWGLLRGVAGDPVEVELRCTARVARWIQEEERGIEMTFDPQPDGRISVRFRIGVTDEMVRWVLGFGPECQVLQPEELRQQVQAMAQETAKLYG